jgi:hypothetical protein
VLYEVANESSGGGTIDRQFADQLRLNATEWGDSTEWQYWVIRLLKSYEEEAGYQEHPVGMPMQVPVADPAKVNEALFGGPADWISPGSGTGPTDAEKPGGDWLADPPANDGRKVVLSDTDHYSPFEADALWAWKSFLRGHNPLLYDLGIVGGVNPNDASHAALEPARVALGDTLRYARRVQLADMEPRGELSSTGYALANAGRGYLVLQPADSAEPFTLDLVAGTYGADWFGLDQRIASLAQDVTAANPERTTFSAPFEDGGAVLYLKRM